MRSTCARAASAVSPSARVSSKYLPCRTAVTSASSVGVLFDHWIGEHLASDALHMCAGSVGREPLGEGKLEVLALPHCGYLCESDLPQRVLDGLALGVQDRCLQRDIDMCLHYPRL